MDELTQLLKKAGEKIKHSEPEQSVNWDEYPNDSQKCSLLMRIEQSSISDRLEDYIRVNIDLFTLEEFRLYWRKVLDQTFTSDPKKQFEQFIYKQHNPTFF